jgi:predicted Zn-dependent protease
MALPSVSPFRSRLRFPLRWAVPLLALACWPASTVVLAQVPTPPSTTSNVVLPALGDAAAQELSPMAERRLGDSIMRSILRDPDVVDDPLVLEYVNQIWQSLVAAARRRGEIGPELEASHAWEPFLVRDKTVNAFALPGGYIGVHFGLLAMTTSPDELASVLAHELSHVTQRHIARMIGQQSRQSWVSLASMVLGLLAASRNPDAAQAMIYGGQAMSIQNQLNFSRDMEREADRVGFGVLTDAGYEPSGMALMFEHLEQASRLNDDGTSYPYLRTHPLTTARIGEARARLGPGGWDPAKAGRPKDNALWAQHTLMSARSRVLMDNRTVWLQTLSTPDIKPGSTPIQRVASYYTAGVASQRINDLPHAFTYLDKARDLIKSLPSAQQATAERIVDMGIADNLLLAHRAPEAAALQARDQAAAQTAWRPDGRPEVLLQAQIALALPAGRDLSAVWSEAASRLQTQVSNHPHDATAWADLAEIWQKLGQPLRAVRAEAEATAALGDLPGAIERIQGAEKRFRYPSAADVIELSVMDARLKAWQKQQREDMNDEKGS